MNRQEHLLTILGEEGTEVAHRVSKALRFSLEEVQPGQSLSNAERIVEEFTQLVAMVEMLASEGTISLPPDNKLQEIKDRKKQNVEKYLEYSRTIGTLQD